jgi:hypothetical protein
MPITDVELVDLRLRYDAAYDAYQSRAQAVVDLGRRGEQPSPQLLASEAKALETLVQARERYRAALGQLTILSDGPPPVLSGGPPR